MASTGKIAVVYFDKWLETYEQQDKMVDLTDFWQPSPSDMQNANNFMWRPVQQHAPILDGFDITGQETDIIEETYPAILGTPKNDFVEQRLDQVRDTGFWERRAEASARQQVTELNQTIANAAAIQGSLFYRSTVASGFDFISEGQTIMDEREGYETQRCYLLNNRSSNKFAEDLAGRQTLQGRPERVWMKGQITQNTASYDVFTGSFLPTLTGGADPATTVTGAQSFKPEGGSVDPTTGVVTNVDYRSATVTVTSSAGYNVGDKVTFPGVNALGISSKNDTGQLMTFTIVAIPDGASVTLYPKPIALDDPGLTTLQKAYANVNTQIADTVTMNRLNTDTTARTNLFWDKDAIEVYGGTSPVELFKEFEGMKVISERMSNGQEIYMVYDASLPTWSVRFRVFSWYGVTVKDPRRVGVSIAADA